MTLRTLERTAIAGLLIGVGLLVVDAIEHDPANFFRYIPRLRPGRGAWWHTQSLWHNRPELLLGFTILCAALVLALIAVVTALVREISERDLPDEIPVETGSGLVRRVRSQTQPRSETRTGSLPS